MIWCIPNRACGLFCGLGPGDANVDWVGMDGYFRNKSTDATFDGTGAGWVRPGESS